MRQTFRLAGYTVALGALLFMGATVPVRAQTPGNQMNDATVTTKIKAELLKDQSLKSFEIHVDTSPTIIHLTGTVPTAVNRADAERIAKGEAGGRTVKDDIVVH